MMQTTKEYREENTAGMLAASLSKHKTELAVQNVGKQRKQFFNQISDRGKLVFQVLRDQIK